jgi:membrane protease YdiL (CAAX protease family)
MAGMSVPAAPSPKRFGASQAWIIFLSYIGVQLALGFVVGFMFSVVYALHHHGRLDGFAEEMRLPLAIGALAGVIAGGLAAWWLARRAARRDLQQPTLALFGWRPSDARAILAAVLTGLALGAVYMALAAIFPPPRSGHMGLIARTVSGGGWPLVVWGGFAVLIAPPVEEFVFRGVMWTGLERSWGPLAAALAVTGTFVLLHVTEAGGYPLALVAIGSLGLAALVARVLTDSLVPAVLLHSGYNFVVVGALAAGST